MSDARRRAEEALAAWKTCSRQHDEACSCGAWPMEEALRALLAAEPGGVVCDGHGETYDEVYRDRERLRESVEIERDGQRSMARALAEINRLSRLDVAVNLAEPAPACGSVSTVRSDDPPAAPLPTCAACGSNFIMPASADDAVAEAAERLRADDVEWVVNSLGELGVKIGAQFFFLYKGESLVYRHGDDEDGPLLWRHVGKREFGECCHPINDADPTRYGTVDVNDGREWRPLLAALDARGRG